MPVALQLPFPDFSLDDYDKVCEALNFPSDWPDGLLAHGSAEVDGGLRVTDVWESREKFDAFAEARLQKAMGEALGDRAAAPDIREIPLHTFYAQG